MNGKKVHDDERYSFNSKAKSEQLSKKQFIELLKMCKNCDILLSITNLLELSLVYIFLLKFLLHFQLLSKEVDGLNNISLMKFIRLNKYYYYRFIAILPFFNSSSYKDEELKKKIINKLIQFYVVLSGIFILLLFFNIKCK